MSDSGHSGGGLHHGLHNWSGSNSSQRSEWSREDWGSDDGGGLANRVNKTILINILRESLQGDWSQTTLGGNKVTEGSSEGSSDRSIIDIGGSHSKQLGVSLSLSLVQTVDGLVASTGERPSVPG